MPNRLARERSPYLRQHADNPVDWYPWGQEAFADAAARDRPILLSVGYSACHWCHVMAHESFEDPEVAGVMNDMFVNIKVDREERPDVDSIYMEATQAMTGSGGWPMTVFLAPDQRPFYAGTYFPKPRFLELLGAVDDAWRNQRDAVHGQADQLTDAIRARTAVSGSHDPDPGVVDAAVATLQAAHDPEWGGFGRAPKFPMTSNLELLMRRRVMEPVITTLDAMASGGIYDHLGGGFHRYSVDAFWMVPHFEKMLYDNALIPRAYLQAWQITGEPRFKQVVEETLGYVLRDLRRPHGGFASAEDADSEGEEGRFYVWRPEQIEAATDEHQAAEQWYGVTKAGNFEGANILHRPVRGDLLRPPEVERARADLLLARSQRPRPGLDDKVLTEWNAMFVATLAQAGAAIGEPAWIAAAEDAAEYLLAENRVKDRWLRSSGSPYLAYAADVAHLVDAFTRLAEASGHKRWIERAVESADQLLELFWDPDDGGVWTTGADAEALLVRTKDVYDGAVPSANSTAALALTRLGALVDEHRYRDAAIRTLRMLDEYLRRAPTAVTTALAAIDVTFPQTTEIVISGDRPDLVEVVHRRYLPTAVLAWGEPYRSPLWEGRGQPAAYVCRNYTCGLPATTAEELSAQLDR